MLCVTLDLRSSYLFKRRKMKYSEIKKDALRLMGIIPDTVENEYDTSKIRAYLVGMNNSIMRAIDRMKSLSLIPPICKELQIEKRNESETYSLKELGIDGIVVRVLKLDGVQTVEEDFVVINDKISVNFEIGEKYFIEYIPRTTSGFSDNDEVNIPDELARLIPYYIKADLYEEEEPSLATAARNIFEGYLNEYADNVDSTVRGVKAVYSLC